MDIALIVGCGDIGRRVGVRCREEGAAVTGVVRSVANAEALAALGITPLRADLDDPATLTQLPIAGSVVFYFAPPPGEGETDTRLAHFLAAADAAPAPPARVVYISTSAVYGDSGGAWIDEDAPLAPTTPRGRRRLAAERALGAWGGRTGVAVVILRVPGIYAPDRLPEARLRQGLPVLRAEDCPWTNRIHADDLATACLAAAARGRPGAAYNVSDGHPSTMHEYFSRVADHLGLPRPRAVDRAEAERVLSPGMLSFLRDNKRLDNRRLREELGVELRYPDLEAGLGGSSRG